LIGFKVLETRVSLIFFGFAIVMSLPPIKLKGRGSLSLPKSLQSNFTSSNDYRYYEPQIPIIRLDKKMRPEINVKKIYSKRSVPSIENIKMKGSRLSPILPSPGLLDTNKKSTYLKKKYVDYIQDRRVSEYANDFTKPIRDYFSFLLLCISLSLKSLR
jgi:hypothetical protein